MIALTIGSSKIKTIHEVNTDIGIARFDITFDESKGNIPALHISKFESGSCAMCANCDLPIVQTLQNGTHTTVQQIQTTATTGSAMFFLGSSAVKPTNAILDENSNGDALKAALEGLSTIERVDVEYVRQSGVSTWQVTFVDNVGTLELLKFDFPSASGGKNRDRKCCRSLKSSAKKILDLRPLRSSGARSNSNLAALNDQYPLRR